MSLTDSFLDFCNLIDEACIEVSEQLELDFVPPPAVVDTKFNFDIYTDASCRRNGSSTAFVKIDDRTDVPAINRLTEGGSWIEPCTSNEAELRSILAALSTFPQDFRGTIRITTDSQFAIRALHKPEDCQYPQLAKACRVILDKLTHWEARWVKGHNGDPYNEYVDSLAERNYRLYYLLKAVG